MRFLADESCDFRVVEALRDAGHDVKAVIEVLAGADDATVITMAAGEQRILLTEDRDFGRFVFATGNPTPGVILLRFPSASRSRLPEIVVNVVSEYGDRLARRFVVLQHGRIRFGAVQTKGST